jgi:hypothetical protein
MCPIHVAPYFRNKELHLESVGMINTINSDGYNNAKSAEAVGAYHLIPVITFNLAGKQTTAKE